MVSCSNGFLAGIDDVSDTVCSPLGYVNDKGMAMDFKGSYCGVAALFVLHCLWQFVPGICHSRGEV